MTQKDLNNWIMYHEIHKLKRLGFSKAKIASHLVLDARTVKKYLLMSEQEYENFLFATLHRNKVLTPYENFVKERLNLFPDTSAAQIHDWLKEHYHNLPEITPRTVYNFVMAVRQKFNIPIVKSEREYFPIEELPYGEQAQVDFGDYNLREANGKRKKVKFFAMVLSRSRMKYVWFLDKPFTADTVCQAHENAFSFFGGIPKTIVYDQDRTMVVDENIGDVILTFAFKQYTRTRSFALHFCRKADPESKGKVENVIQYVKKNFLYNRVYSDLSALNQEALAWLARTANCLPHNLTKKSPEKEFSIEKGFLSPYIPITIDSIEKKLYHVRKDNKIAYKSNFYSVPMGTYQGPGTQVELKENDKLLEIYNLNNELICSHNLSAETGQIIINTHHKRDTSKSLEEIILQVSLRFTDQPASKKFVQMIKEKYPRYTRDHLQVILKATESIEKEVADKALLFCIQKEVLNGYEFEQVLQVLNYEVKATVTPQIKLLNEENLEKANQMPETSDLQEYEKIINP
jgi:transposase